MRNLFKLKKENQAIKNRIIRDIRNPFENKEEDHYTPVRVINFWSNNYIEYKSYGDKNNIISIEEYLNKIRQYLKNIINNLKKLDTWEIQLMMSINFISSLGNDEESLMHSKSDNVEMMINDKEDEVIEGSFQSLLSRYQIGLETSMNGRDFIFDWVFYCITNALK